MVRLLFDQIKGKNLQNFLYDAKSEFTKLSVEEKRNKLLNLF
jgi:hypothetical protein